MGTWMGWYKNDKYSDAWSEEHPSLPDNEDNMKEKTFGLMSEYSWAGKVHTSMHVGIDSGANKGQNKKTK